MIQAAPLVRTPGMSLKVSPLDWIRSCEFHPLSNVQVLNEVHERIRTERTKSSVPPVLLLDLDSTLYEVGSRSYQILREWLASSESAEFPKVRARIERMTRAELGYSLLDTFNHLGLSVMDSEVEAALKASMKFWGRRFFTDDYLAYDEVYPGAPAFVQKAYDLGAEIIYLTGRDEPGMGRGTRSRLLKDQFPFDVDRTQLILKKSFELDDLDHKAKASDYVKTRGNLVASFENEPPNLISFSEIFPEAMHVFVDTVYSDRHAVPKSGLYRITGYESP